MRLGERRVKMHNAECTMHNCGVGRADDYVGAIIDRPLISYPFLMVLLYHTIFRLSSHFCPNPPKFPDLYAQIGYSPGKRREAIRYEHESNVFFRYNAR